MLTSTQVKVPGLIRYPTIRSQHTTMYPRIYYNRKQELCNSFYKIFETCIWIFMLVFNNQLSSLAKAAKYYVALHNIFLIISLLETNFNKYYSTLYNYS